MGKVLLTFKSKEIGEFFIENRERSKEIYNFPVEAKVYDDVSNISKQIYCGIVFERQDIPAHFNFKG